MVESTNTNNTNTNNDKDSTDKKKKPVKNQACTNCRQKKIKCDGGKPSCSSCLKGVAECLYVPSRRRGRPARAHREYERPYTNPLPILPKQPATAIQQRQLPTLPHLQPAQAGQGTMPPPAPTGPQPPAVLATPLPPIYPHPHPHQYQYQQQRHHHYPHQHHQHNHVGSAAVGNHGQSSSGALGSILAAALLPGSPSSAASEDDMAGSVGQSGHRSSGSESPLPQSVRPPAFLVPAGDRGGHRTMAQATPLVIPRPANSSQQLQHVQQVPAAVTSDHGHMKADVVEFFHYFNALFPIVHWPSFKEAYDDKTIPNYLIFAIQALSKRYSKQPSVVLSGQLYAAGQDLAAIATSLAEVATREDPNTYLIQTWIILSMFEFGMGRMKQAADRRELAVRLAYQLELSNIEMRAGQRRARSLIVAENCRRVWWTLFYADRYFSLVSSDPEIGPAIHEATYRVGFPRSMREEFTAQSLSPDKEFPRYNDHDVILWFQSAIPLSMLIGHVGQQCRAAERLFRNGLAARSSDSLWRDTQWVTALNEFVKHFLVIDAEITQWRQQLNAARNMYAASPSQDTNPSDTNNNDGPAHSTKDVTLFHRELQYHGLVIIHQCLALYAYEKLRLNLATLSSACTSLLWLESTATHAWKKVVKSADVIRTKVSARSDELSRARASGRMANGTSPPEPEWELCAPHMPFLLYLSAKVHICQYHWLKIALEQNTPKPAYQQHPLSMVHSAVSPPQPQQQPSSSSSHVTPSFVQPFSQPSSISGTPQMTTVASNEMEHQTNGLNINVTDSPALVESSKTDGESGNELMEAEERDMEQEQSSSRKQSQAATPIMTTSGTAALAAAAHQQHQKHQQQEPQMSASLANGNMAMQVDDNDDNDTKEESIESKLARRVSNSQEHLGSLLKLLTTCQEYWADHDYVHMVRVMLDWPHEWTMSMHMLEKLLLELRID